ncbi:MAG: acyl carrier protein [Clostridia bacterium]|nr:acyl carrier protein [Oscillospiraceae bacterium]MBQ2828951.1 acyl carrier protein [Clostridia bacterium]
MQEKMIEELKAIIEEYTDEPLPEISMETALTADFGLNSFELFEIICKIEEKYNVTIPDRVLMSFASVGDVVNYLMEATK